MMSSRRRTQWTTFGLLLVGSIGLIGYVHNVITIEERLRHIAALRRACDSMEAVLAARRQILAQLEAPERIIPAAQKLGFEIATTVRYAVPTPLSGP